MPIVSNFPGGEPLPELNFDPAGSAAGVQANLTAHENNKNNPHQTTAEQIGAVSNATTVNGKPLTGNISLTAGDVGAATTEYVDNSVATKANVDLSNVDNATLKAKVEASGFSGGAANILDGSQSGSVRTSESVAESGTYTIGVAAFAEGWHTQAAGEGSHAEGRGTKANGLASHAEGQHTNAEGMYSHAEGDKTTALKDCSHAEGKSSNQVPDDVKTAIKTETSSILSESETKTILSSWEINNFSLAGGPGSHAEGGDCLALGKNSHAEGTNTFATSEHAHAEGWNTQATWHAAHAEGYYTLADAPYAHAEGEYTQALGDNSHAEGKATTALKDYSHAEGCSSVQMPNDVITAITSKHGSSLTDTEKTSITTSWNTSNFSLAGGVCSHVEGNNCLALGLYSHAEGNSTQSLADNSHAEGVNTEATGSASHAEGGNTDATGKYSHAEGFKTLASGDYSHAEGMYAEASANYSHAEGYNTSTNGQYSHAGGYFTIANKYQTVIGRFNKDSAGPTSDTDTTGDIFIIGYGTGSTAKNNAIRTTAAGKTYLAKSLSSSGADYAEYFEWLDGNPNNEDRRGLFVTLDGEKIRKANPEDDFILGVISATPCVEGDGQSEIWHGMYLTDVFGEKLTETVEAPESTDEETGIVTPAHTEVRWILNPDYEPEQEYIRREDRNEWVPVGLIGKLVVTDDGTCQVNGYCKVGENGKATASEEKTNYRVMKRMDDTHIKVFIK